MKKAWFYYFLILIAFLFACCEQNAGRFETDAEADTTGLSSFSPALLDDSFVFDQIRMDIDADGLIEDCTLFAGPTSGLFSFVIRASSDGEVKYQNAFISDRLLSLKFDAECDHPAITYNGGTHKLSLSDNRIVIEGFDAVNGGYLGWSEYDKY